MKKETISSFIILSGSFILGSNLALANNDEDIIYNLEDHHFIETFKSVEDGEDVDITIVDNSMFSRLADKSYTIYKNRKNCWAISYKISVKNNKITSASDGNFKAVNGNFSNTSVKKNSNSNAVGKGTWKYRSATNSVQVKATISNKKLKIQ